MNVFKILASCNGNISETNISAMLVYLLDPSNDHGLGDKFLKKIVGKLKNEELKNNKKLQSYLANSSGYEVDIEYEFPVNVEETDSANSTRYIDILIKFYKPNTDEQTSTDEYLPEFTIAIENKIRKESLSNSDQISDEVAGLKKNYDGKDVELHFILLYPEYDEKVKNSLSKISDLNNIYILWKGDNSVTKILNEILNEEAQGTIDPLTTETKYIVKSFIEFVNNDFQSDDVKEQEDREQADYKQPIRKYLSEIRDELDDKEYYVKDIKDKLSKKVKAESGQILKKSTQDCQIRRVTVNAPSRVNLGIRRPLDDESNRFNLFYYSDSDKTKIKKFDYKKSPENIDIYWKEKDETKWKTLSELSELLELRKAGKI